MIDASKGFKKDGPKKSPARARYPQDRGHISPPGRKHSALRPHGAKTEIADPKNDFNLNLPRYIDSTESEDLQDIDGHLCGGIPKRDLDALGDYWKIMPGLRATLFGEFGRPGYAALNLPINEVKPAIFGHTEFTAFTSPPLSALPSGKRLVRLC